MEEQLKRINIKLQQLLKQYQLLKKDNDRLNKTLKEQQEKDKACQQTIEALQQQVLVLRSTMQQMPEADKKELEKRINKYIKELDKTINYLGE